MAKKKKIYTSKNKRILYQNLNSKLDKKITSKEKNG